jgi:hypothetical protein
MITRRRAALIALVAVTLAAWSTIILPTINYASYYSALAQFTFSLSNFTITNQNNSTTVSMVFVISNPTPYVGLRFLGVSYQARITAGNGPTTIGLGNAGFPQAQVLQAYSSYHLPTSFTFQGLSRTQYLQIYNATNGNVPWSIEGAYSLQTRDGILPEEFQIPVTQKS